MHPERKDRAMIKTARSLSVMILAVLSVGGCSDLTVPDLNNPSTEDLTENPSAAAVATAAQGLLRTTRDNLGEMIPRIGAFGREGYPMSQTGASLVGTVLNPLNGANFPGNTGWDAPYRNVRDANLVLAAVDGVPEFSEADKAAVRGFTKTLQAYSFMFVAITRAKFGGPIDVGREPTGDPAPFVGEQELLQHVAQLLDDGADDLGAAGGSFPLRLTDGFSDFDTPATFLEVNRALRARVAAYLEDWPGVMSALNASFLDVNQPLDYGAYHVFSTNAGDNTNPLNDPEFLFAHTRLLADAQERSNGEPDLRAQNKLVQRTPLTASGITSDLNFTMYNTPTAPIPMIKNEELVLLRAEARLQMNQPDLARDDINIVREQSGGLEPLTTTDFDELLDELIYNRLYSLVWEYGHHWVDMRRYDRLLQIPTTSSDPLIVDAMPIPENECTPRDPRPEGCGAIPPVAQ